jgi:hypothetical protein
MRGSYLFLFQVSRVSRVELEVVEFDGEGGGVLDGDLLLIPGAVGQDGAELHQVSLKLQPRLQTLAPTQQQDALAALGDADGDALLVVSLYQQ